MAGIHLNGDTYEWWAAVYDKTIELSGQWNAERDNKRANQAFKCCCLTDEWRSQVAVRSVTDSPGKEVAED
jgi:hypothetical protein